jgi:hypothetical protein
VAVARTVIVPDTVAPSLGEVMVTVGGMLSTFDTVTLTVLLVVVLPAASRATAVRMWAPLLAAVVVHDTL